MYADPLQDTYELVQRSRALVAMSRRLMLRTSECVENTHRALQTSFAQLDRKIPTLLRAPAHHAGGLFSFDDSSRSAGRNSENGIPHSVEAARPTPIKSTVFAS